MSGIVLCFVRLVDNYNLFLVIRSAVAGYSSSRCMAVILLLHAWSL